MTRLSRWAGAIACALGLHDYKMEGGCCRDGWVWVTDRCTRCRMFSNPFMASGIADHDRRTDTGLYR